MFRDKRETISARMHSSCGPRETYRKPSSSHGCVQLQNHKIFQLFAYPEVRFQRLTLPATTDIAAIWIIGRARRNGHGAGLRDRDGVLGIGGGGNLRGGSEASDGESENEEAGNGFHDGYPKSCICDLSNLLYKFDRLSIRVSLHQVQ